ncbi:MAG: hypothetical protein ACLPXB_07075 [Thiobacillaceae bacterium]
MANYIIELDIINSGSPNDLNASLQPAKGAASECYINVIPSTGSPTTLRVGNFVNNNISDGNVQNGGTYKNFVDISNRNANVTSVDIPTNDPGLSLAYSIYWGNRTFDGLIGQAITTYLSTLAGPLITSIVKVFPSFLQDLANKTISAPEQKVIDDITNSFKNIIVPIGLGQIGPVPDSATRLVVPIRSIANTVHDQFTRLSVIQVGDLVGNVILTPA